MSDPSHTVAFLRSLSGSPKWTCEFVSLKRIRLSQVFVGAIAEKESVRPVPRLETISFVVSIVLMDYSYHGAFLNSFRLKSNKR